MRITRFLCYFFTQKQIINLTSMPPTLEDLFMRYYEKQGADSHE